MSQCVGGSIFCGSAGSFYVVTGKMYKKCKQIVNVRIFCS